MGIKLGKQNFRHLFQRKHF